MGKLSKTDNLHGCSWTCFLDLFTEVIEHGFHLTSEGATNKGHAHFQGAGLNHYRGGRSLSCLHTGLNNRSPGIGTWVGLELQDLGLKCHQINELIHALAGRGRDFHTLNITAKVNGLQAVLHELSFHPGGIRSLGVTFVDGDNDRFARLLGEFNGLDGLGHDAVIGSHHEYHDVGNICTTGTHLREDRVARGINKADGAVTMFNAVGSDMLGNAPSLTRSNPALSDEVQQRCLTVVNVTHECNNRGAILEFFFVLLLDGLGLGLLDLFLFLMHPATLFTLLALKAKTVHLTKFLRDIWLDRLMRCHKDLKLDKICHQLEGLELHQVCQITDNNGRLDGNDVAGFFATAAFSIIVTCRIYTLISAGRGRYTFIKRKLIVFLVNELRNDRQFFFATRLFANQ